MRQSTRIWWWIVAAPVMVPVVWFSVSNRDQITLHLTPFPFDMVTPIWALTLIELFAGFLLGGIVIWIDDRHRRRDARQLARRVTELEKSLAAARQQAGELERKLGEVRAQPTLPVPTSPMVA